jgi:hypothetical protein
MNEIKLQVFHIVYNIIAQKKKKIQNLGSIQGNNIGRVFCIVSKSKVWANSEKLKADSMNTLYGAHSGEEYQSIKCCYRYVTRQNCSFQLTKICN